MKSELLHRKQGPNEPVSNYVLAKLDLCHQIKQSMDEDTKLDHLYEGLRPEIKRQLYSHQPQTIAEFLDFAKRIERGISSDTSSATNEQYLAQILAKMNELSGTRERSQPNFSMQPRRTYDNRPICWSCGRKGHHFINFRTYPADPANPQPRNPPPARTQTQPQSLQTNQDSRYTSNIVNLTTSKAANLLTVNGIINQLPAVCLIDTGAVCSIISSQIAKHLDEPLEPYSGKPIFGVGGQHLKIKGATTAAIKFEPMVEAVTTLLLVADD